MKVFIQQNTKTQRVFTVLLAGFAISALVLWFFPFRTQGAVVASRSDVLSDSRPSSTPSNHTVSFTTVAADDIGEGETVVVDFGGGSDVFGLGSIALGDIDFEVGGTDHNLVAAAGCTGTANQLETVINTTNDNITFTRCTSDGAIAGGSAIVVKVGTNADGGTNQITNPVAAGVQDVTIAGTFQTSAVTSTIKVAVISGVTVSATIAETLTFTVAAVTGGNCTNPTGGTDVGTSATAIDYTTIAVDAFNDGCQDLTVTTNSVGGYATTVKMLDELTLSTDGTTEISRGSCESGCTISSGTTWTTPGTNGFAYCMDDQTGAGSANAGWASADQCDDGTPLFRLHPINPGDTQTDSPTNIMQASIPSNHTARIAHRLSVDALQAAGPYTGTIVYVTTATY